MKHFQASDGTALAYHIDDFTDPWRPAETLVLLHSAMSCAARFFAWVPHLSRHYRVARLDLRGHGNSDVPPPSQDLTVARLVSDAVEFLDEIGCDRAHFVGASAGGYLCQRMAMDHPDRVLSLCLFGSTPGFKRSQGPSWLPLIKARGLRTFLAETIDDRFPIGDADPGLVEWFLDQAGGNDEDYIVRFIGLMTQQDWSDELGKIACPTFLAIPGLGKIGEDAAYDPMKEKIADITVKVYENMPHNIWDARPDRCADDVLSFLRAKFPG